MAYDKYMADRIDRILRDLRVQANTKKMMGGLCFMVDDKMCLGVSIDKSTNKSRLIARIGQEAAGHEMSNEHCSSFSPTGRIMKDFVSISEEGIEQDDLLIHWIQLAIDFNPLAKSSKKK